MKHWIRILPVAVAGLVALSGCTSDEPVEETPTTVTTATTATTTDTETTTTIRETPTGEPSYIGIPGSRFVELIADVPETDPTPYASALIFPEQPGLQFQGPDGTYCEMYSDGEPVAMCTHDGEGDINAVSVREGEPATTHHVNRIFVPGEQTVVLEPGNRLVEGPVSCAVAEGEVKVMCAIDFYSFAVSRDGVELS
ncbi:hypothetical protein NYP18_09825 [Corynebacterium sp. YIM 101645]|uniref:Secreted protein n=1 Tax=Corynebacterium lemuris TaxID=1859292 RepID=A0ABT2FXI8_9CORY|nr:hypothetical protein [Corynebacterium lemuris]MCS5479953.1 hypothetical protein [Corynebacterium lemuris]